MTTTSGHCSGNTAGRRGAIVRRRARDQIVIATLCTMQDAFGIVLFVVVGVGVVTAVLLIAGTGRAYEQIGRGGLSLDRDDDARAGGGHGPAPGSAAALAERDEEVRQMVAARSARRVARGEDALDVDAEVARLVAPAAAPRIDPALRDEIRQLVVARNERRARQGKEPLDVDAEVARQVAELGG